MAKEHFNDFREAEKKILRLTMVKDNLDVIAEGFSNMDIDDLCINAVQLNADIIEEVVEELKEILDTIEGREPVGVCAEEEDECHD